MDSDKSKKQEISNDLYSEPSTTRASASIIHGGTQGGKGATPVLHSYSNLLHSTPL